MRITANQIESWASVSYDKIESQLRQMACVDDSPIVQIGSVWKANHH